MKKPFLSFLILLVCFILLSFLILDNKIKNNKDEYVDLGKFKIKSKDLETIKSLGYPAYKICNLQNEECVLLKEVPK